jgi:membrane associated rhomboid family serine protease
MLNSRYSATGMGFNTLPIAIRSIIAISVVSFLIGLIFPQWLQWFAYIPDWKIALTQPWRIVTYLFLHHDVWHILFNMLWLYWMGRQVEMDLGPRTFSSIYFISGIGGALLNLLLSGVFGTTPVIGASGAVYGIMVAFALLYPNAPIMLFLLPPLPAKYVIAGLIAIDVILIGDKTAIARLVHVGGALTGFVVVRAHLQGISITKWIDFLMYYVQKFQHSAETIKSTAKAKAKPKNSSMRIVDDVQIIEEIDQTELDRILDKIAKTGYDGLSADEKRVLFEMSKRK